MRDVEDIARNLCSRRFGRLEVRWYRGSNSDFINWGILRDEDYMVVSLGRLEIEW